MALENISAELIGAVAGAALLAALAFRYLVQSVIRLNEQLQEAIDERLASEEERQTLRQKVVNLEFQVASLQSRLDEQAREIQSLQSQLLQRDQVIEGLRQKIQQS